MKKLLITGSASKTSTQPVKGPARGTTQSTSIFWLFWVFSSWSKVIMIIVSNDQQISYNIGMLIIENLVAFPLFIRKFLTYPSFSFHSLYPHLFSRAYINFKNHEDILLFRDRFDGYVFIDNKGISWFCLNSVWLCTQYDNSECRHTVQSILLY